MEGRFGPLDPALLAALAEADAATLRALMPHLATETLDQLRARLLPTRSDQAADPGTPPA
jgi:hypothetical protein